MKVTEIIRELELAGCEYDNRQAIIKAITSVDVEILLVPEPDNYFDQSAINVFFNKRSIGYIPAFSARNLTNDYLARGCRLSARLKRINQYSGGTLVPVVSIYAPEELLRKLEEEEHEKKQVEEEDNDCWDEL